jgi:adenine-specific DNA-methyltransferase
MNNNFDSLIDLLKTDERYVAEDGDLLKAKVYQDAMMMEENLLNLLLSQEETKEAFFTKVGNTLVFDKYEFAWLINSKEFLPDSYTAYTNKIGLAANRKFISQADDVVLDFPYKDAVLAGGQDKDDQKRDEIMFHNILAREQIMNMLTPKVFTNAKRYTTVGDKDLEGQLIPETIEVKEELATEFKEDDNLIIKGNNLIALSSLLERYEGKVKLIYIDPPYNTGSDSFGYNDSFNRSTWLTFMKNRLELARELLAPDGAIYVQLDYHQVHYAKVLMDEIFGEENFQREIIWRIGWVSGYKSADNNWIRNHDTILFYSKNDTQMKFIKHYIPRDEFKVIATSEAEKYPVEDVWNGNEYDDLNSIAIVSFSGETVSKMLEQDDAVKGQKSEKLIERIIKAHTEENDIILDFFGGTGTSGAVALKTRRRFIMCEQLDKHTDIMLRRLNKVMEGEQSGVSRKNNWQGGGSFVYCELKEDGQTLIDAIQASDDTTISKIKDRIYQDERIVPYLTTQELEKVDNTFEHLDIDDKKKALIELIDKNKLYINYSSIDDEDYDVSDEDKSFTHSFYEVTK